MLIKSDPTTTNSSPAMPAATVCGNCGAEERRLLHQVRHRSNFRRLCTTCVLRLHPQAFCPTCFQVYPPTLPNDVVRTCVKCYSHSHSHCVDAAGAPPPNPYVCPLCVNPSAPIFKLKPAKEAKLEIDRAANARAENCRVLDWDSARMLLAAAKIASSSMNKAAVAARAEAERRVKEAAYTRKRAKEALEHVAHLVIKEKARRKEAALDVPGRGYAGIPHFTPPPKMATEVTPNTANVGVSNRNGGVASVVVEEKISNVVNVDRDNSNQVLAALDVPGRGYAGIPHFAPPAKMATEVAANTANVGVSNRNGGVASASPPLVVVGEKISNVVNVDRDNSNQVLAALNAVELRESEKIGAAQGEGNDHTPMDVDDGGMRLNVTDMETDAGNGNNHGGVNNEMALVQKKENDDGVNRGLV